MRTHLRRDLAQKVVPSTNQFSIGFSIVKCPKYNQFFHPRYKSSRLVHTFVLGSDILNPVRDSVIFLTHGVLFCKKKSTLFVLLVFGGQSSVVDVQTHF